jgi:uncharacterized protein DUF2795
LKSVLVGVALPARRNELLAYAVQQRAEPPLLDALSTLSDQTEYESLDDVVEELLQVQPKRVDVQPHEPETKSGKPPGGESYTEKHPTPGAVRR